MQTRLTSDPVYSTTAFAATPERFVRRPPVPAALPAAAWIKPPKLLVAKAISEDVGQ